MTIASRCLFTPALMLLATAAVAQTPGGGAPPVSEVTSERLLNAQNEPGSWLMYGGNYANDRYSKLTKINTKNVSQLVPRQIFQTGIAKLGSFENTPIVVDGVMYVTTPYNTAMAYDLKTRKELWRYEHKLGTTIYCCGPNNRGVAIHGPHLYMGTLDGRLVALNRKDGSVAWDIEVADPAFGYSITHAPLVVGNNVLVGVSGGEYGIRGHLTAYNAVDGKQVWRWYSIPAPKGDPTFDEKAPNGWWGTWPTTTPDGADLHRDVAKEKGDSAKYADAWKTGGGGVWMNPAYDPETQTLYVTVGNPSPDLDGSIRPGDNLYTDCVVAIDATNGKTKWYYQTVPHDVWDLDAVSPPVITTLNGKKVVVHAGKTAWVYVLDAATGKLIRRTDNFTPQENMFALPTGGQGTRMLPGANGGSEWSPISINPTLNYAYVAGLHQPMWYRTNSAPWEKGRLWLGSAFVAIPGEEQYGLFSAVNLATGKIAWQNKVPQPMMGGSLATAGGLVFTGEGNGNFNAYDAKSGKLLWQFNAGAGCNSAPMTFEFEGEQFVAVACGGNFQISYPLGDDVLIFGLPKAAGKKS
ncbi:MAG TPA: PQQ-binding-like beta-propeller repeat protein [Gemmatimonadales bacterium]|nr:PQQ-binding-like beta-propeller repeat protein [Gemmatimonadales bacterium]